MSDFNSHAHVERDLFVKQNMELCKISTHTLTWSVTNFHNNTFRNAKISTHTLTWSVTLVWNVSRTYTSISTHTLTWSVTGVQGFCRSIKNHFNSHAHVERDLCTHRQRPYC